MVGERSIKVCSKKEDAQGTNPLASSVCNYRLLLPEVSLLF